LRASGWPLYPRIGGFGVAIARNSRDHRLKHRVPYSPLGVARKDDSWEKSSKYDLNRRDFTGHFLKNGDLPPARGQKIKRVEQRIGTQGVWSFGGGGGET